jgi:zinc transporter ZupT
MIIFFGIFAILLPVAAGVLVWKRFDQIFLKTAEVDSNDSLPTYLKKLAAVSLTTGFLLFVCFQLLFIFSGEA